MISPQDAVYNVTDSRPRQAEREQLTCARRRVKEGMKRSSSLWSWDLVTSSKEVRCPFQQVDDWKFPQTARHNITGYNLVRRFSLLKTPAIKKIRNPRGPGILRLGKTALIHPTDQVFPHGLPDEFTLVFTLLLKKKTLRDNIYLFQISDEQGYPQFSLDLNGPDATLSLRARGADPLGEPVGCVFRGEGVESILDSGWHKLSLSVQQRAASLHVDCSSIQTKPLEPRGELSTKGHTLLGIRATDAAAVEMDIQQVMVYCDASLAIQESCCEIPGARCPPDAPKSRRAAENDLEQPVLAFNQVIHTQIYQQADQRHQVLTGSGTLLPKHSIGSP
uniref:Collagen alpha-1(XVI) chain n=1 Tax=Hucho hucho TaxID=62062 RepID=A0A4W5RRR0_9TELE